MAGVLKRDAENNGSWLERNDKEVMERQMERRTDGSIQSTCRLGPSVSGWPLTLLLQGFQSAQSPAPRLSGALSDLLVITVECFCERRLGFFKNTVKAWNSFLDNYFYLMAP